MTKLNHKLTGKLYKGMKLKNAIELAVSNSDMWVIKKQIPNPKNKKLLKEDNITVYHLKGAGSNNNYKTKISEKAYNYYKKLENKIKQSR